MAPRIRGLCRILALATIVAFCGLSPAWATPRMPERWVAVWGSSQMSPDAANALPSEDLKDITVRQVVRVSAAGERLRLRLSNAFGTGPLHIDAVHIARSLDAGRSDIDPASDQTVLFNGHGDVVIPSGADYLSDPITLATPALSSLAISLRLRDVAPGQTSHPGARATTFVASGDQVSAAALTTGHAVEHWYFLAGVEAVDTDLRGSIVLLGDSIVDGYGVPADSNGRWSDVLAERVQSDAATRGLSVINQGIGGNRLLADGLGPNAVARFERDVLSQSGVRHVLVLEGVNDLGVLTRDQPVSAEAHAALVAQITGAYRQIVDRARQRGVQAIGATIMPFAGSAYYHPGPETEADRQAINAWIRAPGNFDAVVDFDAMMRDPAKADRLAPAYDSGDGLHPSLAGYRAMGDAVPLDLFKEVIR